MYIHESTLEHFAFEILAFQKRRCRQSICSMKMPGTRIARVQRGTGVRGEPDKYGSYENECQVRYGARYFLKSCAPGVSLPKVDARGTRTGFAAAQPASLAANNAFS